MKGPRALLLAALLAGFLNGSGAVGTKRSIKFMAKNQVLPQDLLLGLERGGGDAPKLYGFNSSGEGSDNEEEYHEPEYVDSGIQPLYECVDVTDPLAESEQIEVLVAISECVSQQTLDAIKNWVASWYPQSEFASWKITITFIPGDCDDDSTIQDPALVPSVGLMADRSNIARLDAFKEVGTVLEDTPNLDETSLEHLPEKYIGVISFVTDEKSYNFAEGRETVDQPAMNFQVCEGGRCDVELPDCFQLKSFMDVFTYQPFKFTHSLQCGSVLPDAIPVVYLDANNERQCYCQCPAGYEIVDGACTPVNPPECECEWTRLNGYRKEICHIEDTSTCTFDGIASDWRVPVPFPTDGYVADGRRNIAEGQNPRVNLVVSKRNDPVFYFHDLAAHVGGLKWPRNYEDIPYSDILKPCEGGDGGELEQLSNIKYSWKSFQQFGDDYLDDIQFTGFGKYELLLDAYDYETDAQCPGCLAIVDHVRPHHTTECPAMICDDSTGYGDCAEFTVLNPDNLLKAQQLISSFYDFEDLAENDQCTQSERCDKHKFVMQNFFEEVDQDEVPDFDVNYDNPAYYAGKQCFNEKDVLCDFAASDKAKQNPLLDDGNNCRNDEEPVKPGQCKRCCNYQTELRELWTDYKCGYDYDTRVCSGDEGEQCSFEQCLVFTGDSVATATAKIKDEVATESEAVLEQIDQKTYNTISQVHRLLKCNDFSDESEECVFEAKLSDLIEVDAEFKWDFEDADVHDFVFWRYRIRGENQWQLWQTNGPIPDSRVAMADTAIGIIIGTWGERTITFNRAETMITIEAWTQCGKVHSFAFYVHLHLNSEIEVCEHFSQMWYQSSVSLTQASDTICAYPGSDFAELTFDYHANIGLKHDRNRARMNISHVTCVGSLDDRTETTILDVPAESFDVVKRFGVELLNRETTEAITVFSVECTFFYVGWDGGALQQTCPRKFNIKDCQGPNFDDDNHHCEWTGCAGKKLPGLYEACGGKIIRAAPSKTYVDFPKGECCQGCEKGNDVECVSLLNLPNALEDLMRCEPTGGNTDTYSPYGQGGYSSLPLNVFLAGASVARDEPGTTVFVVATALVAVVAFITVKRRVSERVLVASDDAYYPLLH